MKRTTAGRSTTSFLALSLALLAFVGSACSSKSATSSTPPPGPTSPSASARASKTEAPVAVESNPPGDIPDSQVYVGYNSAAGHFQVKVPEGWTQTTGNAAVTFTDKLNTIALQWMTAPSAPTVQSVNSNDVPRLRAHTRAFQLVSVKSVSLPAGPAVLVTFRMNSAPNDVTGKQYRDEVLWYALYHSGSEATLQLISPVGADNVDPWHTVSTSFRWK